MGKNQFNSFVEDTFRGKWWVDFTRCKYKNKDGFYGTRGECKQGYEVPPRNKGGGRLASPDLPAGYGALLLTIQALEGTDKSSEPYKAMFGGKTFQGGYKDHPRRIQHNWSDAAGAYQFLSTTWDNFSKTTGIKTFTPRNQDKAAMWLIKGRLSDDEMKGLMKGKLTPETISKLALEWASMPCDARGKSCYEGQPSKTFEEITEIYRKYMRQLST